MAKRQKRTPSSTTSTWDIVKVCAYIAMVIAAVAAMLVFVFGLLNMCGVKVTWAGRVVGICQMVAQIALIVAVVIPAYHYMRPRSAVVRAFFWVAVIFLVLGLVGINLAF